jgi:hypothetical protein
LCETQPTKDQQNATKERRLVFNPLLKFALNSQKFIGLPDIDTFKKRNPFTSGMFAGDCISKIITKSCFVRQNSVATDFIVQLIPHAVYAKDMPSGLCI